MIHLSARKATYGTSIAGKRPNREVTSHFAAKGVGISTPAMTPSLKLKITSMLKPAVDTARVQPITDGKTTEGHSPAA